LRRYTPKEWKSRPSRIQLPMLPEARRLLDEFFAPFNRLLAEELRDHRFLWRTPKTVFA